MAAYERVLVEIAGGIGTVTLNRPEKLNALDRPLCDDLREALALLTQSDVVRVIVITGAGRAFCAGADLDVLDEDGPALVAAGKDVALALRAAPQPVLAAVNGPAAGGGANLALACDYRIASEQASIGQVFHKLGLVPDWGGSFFLPRLVGPSKALELVWSARTPTSPPPRVLWPSSGLPSRPARCGVPKKRCTRARPARSRACSISRSRSKPNCSPHPKRASASRGHHLPRGAADGPEARQLR